MKNKLTFFKITVLAAVIGFTVVLTGSSMLGLLNGAATTGLRVVNNYNAPIGAVVIFKGPNETGDSIVWRSSGVTIQALKNLLDESHEYTFTGVPAGIWSVRVADRTIHDVVISDGMVTTITRDAGGNLTVELPR